MYFLQRGLGLASLGFFIALMGAGPALGAGVVEIQHATGPLERYPSVEVKVLRGSLFLTSEDGQGTIVVTSAACAYQGKVIVCLPTSAAIVQGGSTHALDLRRGTIYLNYTKDPQSLARSSSKIPPNSVILAITTDIGTLVTARGTIDQVIQR